MVGLNEGIYLYESCFGGIGGCPFAPDATGNICSEDLVYMMNEMNIKTGIDINHLIKHDVKRKHIEKRKITSQTILSLIEKYSIKELDLLYVDTEGYDGKIVYEFVVKAKLKPIIIFEYIHIDNKFFTKLINLLNEEKFKFLSINENLICYPPNKDFLLEY